MLAKERKYEVKDAACPVVVEGGVGSLDYLLLVIYVYLLEIKYVFNYSSPFIIISNN